jgi:hypothetical protein
VTVTTKAPSLKINMNFYVLISKIKIKITLCPGCCIGWLDNISRILSCLLLCLTYIVIVVSDCPLMVEALSNPDWTVVVFLYIYYIFETKRIFFYFHLRRLWFFCCNKFVVSFRTWLMSSDSDSFDSRCSPSDCRKSSIAYL